MVPAQRDEDRADHDDHGDSREQAQLAMHSFEAGLEVNRADAPVVEEYGTENGEVSVLEIIAVR